jgi:hypothetical protein
MIAGPLSLAAGFTAYGKTLFGPGFVTGHGFSVCVRTHPCANLLTGYRREAALTRCSLAKTGYPQFPTVRSHPDSSAVPQTQQNKEWGFSPRGLQSQNLPASRSFSASCLGAAALPEPAVRALAQKLERMPKAPVGVRKLRINEKCAHKPPLSFPERSSASITGISRRAGALPHPWCAHRERLASHCRNRSGP